MIGRRFLWLFGWLFFTLLYIVCFLHTSGFGTNTLANCSYQTCYYIIIMSCSNGLPEGTSSGFRIEIWTGTGRELLWQALFHSSSVVGDFCRNEGTGCSNKRSTNDYYLLIFSLDWIVEIDRCIYCESWSFSPNLPRSFAKNNIWLHEDTHYGWIHVITTHTSSSSLWHSCTNSFIVASFRL